ncbi:hypothetical protein C461_09597 [Halorubrum aidingense JCM 13560]|uniref:CARDB domain-containing protein n=1 Tax=Halorubrum aidingense JCM 13560 TaxID=1230454 RepID=M0PA54_9EURY|nr:hypothetical protein [Halorubrum aidingense]EMA67002.1 hypothetical protein C461_09597 [Halorubrum aidingense JCM 13560]
MTLTSIRTTAALLALLAIVGAVGGATAVPDARITIDGVGLSVTDPAVGERTSLNLTVSNSAGSPAAADVTEIRLLDADGETLDEATALGALSAGDSLDAELRTRFDDPGEKRLTVEVVVEQEAVGDAADDGDEDAAGETVTVTRDVVVDVQPAEVALDLRTRALSPEDLQSDDESEGTGVNLGGIEGIFGGGGGGLDTGDDTEEVARAADSPVEVTVVNTGTTTADRVSLTAVGTAVDGDDGAGDGSDEGDAGDGETASEGLDAGPFVVEDVAPGEERRVLVDLGPLDRREAVTFTAAFRSGTDAQAGVGAERTAESTLDYPPREAAATVTDAAVQIGEGGALTVDANLGNVGGGEMEGVVVSVADAPGVEPTPAGEAYFVGTLGASDFVGFDLRTTANASVADEVPIRVEYTERGVRYTETATVALPDADGADRDGAGTFGRFGGALGGVSDAPGGTAAGAITAVGLVGAAALAVVGGVVRRRDV